ncbi:hypothetical protein DXG03_005825 [Asterophora parasitica]|uniref:dolichol kinase n=1 Tax=Asterophora parasitica TaxID=117018 RepID=A0A9P7GDX7_9AGAR|nr:hypothetical protein DXG03_005825 [Asterophora parasitica]
MILITSGFNTTKVNITSASHTSDDDSETEDELPSTFRGRVSSQSGVRVVHKDDTLVASSTLRRRASPHAGSSNDSGSSSALRNPRVPFTRSRSPAVTRPSSNQKISTKRHQSPSVSRFSRRGPLRIPTTFFPTMLEFRIPLFPTRSTFVFSADFRKCGESHILLGAILYASYTIFCLPQSDPQLAYYNLWTVKGLLIAALHTSSGVFSHTSTLPKGWRIEAPLELPTSTRALTAIEALTLSRYGLVDLATFCSAILLLHICASWWLEARYSTGNTTIGERASVPRSEGLRSWYYILFTLVVSAGIFGVKLLLQSQGWGIWQHLNHFEIIFSALFYQFTLYMAIRLAHRGFTLGELGLVCFGGTALSLEFLNITIARIWPVTTPFIKTYRLPTPLLIFQLALIAGSFFTGILLSPVLILSRHIAQRPVRRLRNPQDKQRNRRYLALGFYSGTFVIVVGVIGMWSRWSLGHRDPWLWVLFWIVEGKRKWTRPALLAYWALLGSLSVAGWNRQLARSRKYWPRNSTTGETLMVPGAIDHTATSSAAVPSQATEQASSQVGPETGSDAGAMTGTGGASPVPPSASASPTLVGGMTFPTLPNLPNGVEVQTITTDLLDAADKHVPTLGLNARRKFFHALAVIMFIPGIAFDPAFTHLSFSAAFALFTFTEYVRYFAIYPFGASVHLFMNEFLDHRDRGTAILSHFYLLTGCAGSVWLEGCVRFAFLLDFTPVLIALALQSDPTPPIYWHPNPGSR